MSHAEISMLIFSSFAGALCFLIGWVVGYFKGIKDSGG